MNDTIKILPVIHYLDDQTTLDQVALVAESGADGIFLISHHGDDSVMFTLEYVIRARHPQLWCGINMLNTSPITAVQHYKESLFDGLWMDNVGIHSSEIDPFAYYIRDELVGVSDYKEVFGAVAFKYQKPEPNPDGAALIAKGLGFIPTTSGSGTGYAPDLEKIAIMSHATGGLLACASGMTPENIAQFAPHLSHVLVSTGICDDFYHINERKLKTLITIASEVKLLGAE